MGVRHVAVVGHIHYLRDKKKSKLDKRCAYQQHKIFQHEPTRKCRMENVPTDIHFKELNYQSFALVVSFPFIEAFSKQYFNIEFC